MTKSGYSTYCDGIKTGEMFVERLLKTFGRDTEETLVFENAGAVQGIISYYWIPEDRYVQTFCFNINEGTRQALSEFQAYVREQLPGFDLYMGFPVENREAVEYLAGNGFECIEDDYNNTAFLDRLEKIPVSGSMIHINRDNYDIFRRLHSQIEGDMYWNSDRIFENLDDWMIQVREKDGIPQGTVYYRAIEDWWYEIYGIDMNNDEYDPEVFSDLLKAALNDSRSRGCKAMTFFCDEEYEKITVDCGFTCIGNYHCYRKHLD